MKNIKKLLLAVAFISTNAFADGFSASVGGDYSRGDYGTSESTNVFYVPFTANYETGAFTYSLTVPWIRVNGNGDVVPGAFGGAGGGGSGGGAGAFGCAGDNRKGASKPEDSGPCAGTGITTTTTTTKTRSTESGLGDIIAGLTYTAFDGGDAGFVVDLSGRIKFATASESKGLGSGKNDYAVQVNVDKNFNGPYTSVGLGYKWVGEPSGVNYDNVVFGSLGGGYKFSKDTTLGVSYEWATAAVDGADRPQALSVYASHRINDRYKLSGWLYTGISDASPDVGGGANLSYYF